MTDLHHSITPPPELVLQWLEDSPEDGEFGISNHIATQAARWGADQELEACCEWIVNCKESFDELDLHNARRPKPPSVKQQALALVNRRIGTGHVQTLNDDQADTIRRALEQLND
jgi:hypothetical protein